MLIGPNIKRMRKQTKMEALRQDNIKLRDLVIKLAQTNLEASGVVNEGKQSGEGSDVPALQGGIETDGVAIEEPCGELQGRDNQAAEVGRVKEGV